MKIKVFWKALMYDEERVIGYIVDRDYRYTSLDRDELINIGYIGLSKAKANYNPEYGELSVAYAAFYIKQEINVYLNKYNKFNYSHLELFDDLHRENIEEQLPVEIAPTELIEHEELKGRLDIALDTLDNREKFIMNQIYMTDQPATMVEIADYLGITKQRVAQIKNKCLKKLKQEMCDD